MNVVRVLHLLGGLRALSNPGPTVAVLPASPGRAPVAFRSAGYTQLFGEVRGCGLVIVGCDFMETPEEVSRLTDPNWRPMQSPVDQLAWPAMEVAQNWRNISHAAGQDNRMLVFEKARHVSMQLGICSWRLRDLSDSYHRHLAAVCQTGDFKDGHGFDGCFSQHLFFSAHAMFGELASLRDHLAHFAAREVFGIRGRGVDSWTTLQSDKSYKRSLHPLALYLRDQSEWIDTLGEYRNLFVHNAPLAEAEGAPMVVFSELETPLGKLPNVALRLPVSPADLRARLRAGNAPQSFEHWVEIASARREGPDALAYCKDVFEKMVIVAHHIGGHSPVAPRMMHLTAADMVGPPKFERRVIPPLSVGTRLT